MENKKVNGKEEEKTNKQLIDEKVKNVFNSKDFRDKYIVSFGRKDSGKASEAITSEGLRILANIKGIKSLTTEILQYPNKENAGVCIMKATLVGYDIDPKTDELIEVLYTSIGDANQSNTNKMVAPHFIRMAETRAISRALKLYTNTGLVSIEELYDEDDSFNHGYDNRNTKNNNNNNRNNNNQNKSNVNNNQKEEKRTNNQGINPTLNSLNNNKGRMALNVNSSQVMKVKELLNAKNISNEDFMSILNNEFHVNNLEDVTLTDGFKLIKYLTAM